MIIENETETNVSDSRDTSDQDFVGRWWHDVDRFLDLARPEKILNVPYDSQVPGIKGAVIWPCELFSVILLGVND